MVMVASGLSSGTISYMSEKLARKIALVGTSCIGKTELLDKYRRKSKKDSRITVVEEAAMQYFAANKIKDKFSEASQFAIQSLALNLEALAERYGRLRTFCDRSVLDAPAYLRGIGNVEGSERLLQRVAFWLPTYTSIVLLDPSGIDYRQDDIRDETPETRLLFHEGFLAMFAEHKIPYQLVSGTLSERIKQIDSIAHISEL
ncbi:MAG TPA: ATP-binding protein [Candidatus Saccharimonadia bacterium]|nr:ATP-binding protein [Candidatus Saccharimonadia bacterium]